MAGSGLDSAAYCVLGWLCVQFEGGRTGPAIWSLLLVGAGGHVVSRHPDLEEALVKPLICSQAVKWGMKIA
jgi:hypothetical protein